MLPIPTHCRKGTSYNSILVIVGQLTKMVHSKSAQIIDAPKLAETISDIFQPSLYCCLAVKKTTSGFSLTTGFERCYATSRCRYRLMHPGSPIRLATTKTYSLPPSSGSSGTTFEFNCGYRPHVFYETSNRNLMTTCKKNLPHGLDIANRFPPDLWGYVHGFSY